MTKRRNIVIWTALGLAGAMAAGATTIHQARAERANCPGRIVCPMTGKLVCRDKCPLGEHATAAQDAALPACCRSGV